jgi:hypothetical protein
MAISRAADSVGTGIVALLVDHSPLAATVTIITL